MVRRLDELGIEYTI